MQITGSFKVRGAYNKIAKLTEEEKARGVIAASAGNHAQGVALAAKRLGIKATIVMPKHTPLIKVNATKQYGADVVLFGEIYDEAYQKAMAANYVKVRERYVYPSLQDDYETVQVYNAPQVNDDYLALYAGKNAPDKVYKNGAHTVKVEILSNQITDGTAPDKVATVRYKKIIRRLADNSTRNEYWDARFTFHSDPDKDMSDAEREINYFGFTVTSWQTDREIRGGE